MAIDTPHFEYTLKHLLTVERKLVKAQGTVMKLQKEREELVAEITKVIDKEILP